MKVIHLISGGDSGGAKTHVLSLLQNLNKTITAQLVCFRDGPFAEEARAMVHSAIDAYVQRDVKLAEKVIDQDDVVDQLFLSVKDELVEQLRKDPASALAALDMLMIAKYFERIGDHAENVAEWVIFSITGVREGGGL